MSRKILIALQYCAQDYTAAMELARLIADLQPAGRCPDADFLFSASFNAPLDRRFVSEVGRKFGQMHTFRCRNAIAGWPAGPNNQAFETAVYFADRVLEGRWDYSAVLLAEPDCLPLRADFLTALREEWDSGPATCLGPWVCCGPAPMGAHLNGNSLFAPAFIRKFQRVFRGGTQGGWDALNADILLQFGRASALIFSDYRHGTPQNPWRGCDFLWEPRAVADFHPLAHLGPQRPVWLHGVKCMTEGLACVRERLLPPPPEN